MKIIDSITIRYFRSVYTLNIGQCEDITIVSGRNDVGKSNILKALNLFFCQQSDYLHNFDFVEDYSNIRRDEVKKDTIRGQQFISISIRFLRGNRMENSLPPSFSVTKRWDMHSSECKMTSDVLARMEQFSKKQGKKFSEKTTNIEHYFTDEEIKTELEGKRLFIGNEFYKTGVCKSNPSLYYKSGARVADTIKIIEHESNNYVMNADGTGDYSISKSAFVNAICEEKDSFKGFSFDEFQKIFDVINSIVSSSKE